MTTFDPATLPEVSAELLKTQSWTPPEGVLSHAGRALETDAVFFIPPPSEIGEVTSAQTSRRLRRPARPAWFRLVATAVGLVPSGIFFAISYFDERHPELYFLFAILALAISPLAWLLSRETVECSYVGRLGAVRFTLQQLRRRRGVDYLLFENANEVRVEQMRMYTHGIYAGTKYSFAWTGIGGATLLKLSGVCRGNKKPPTPRDPFHFARAAEIAWCEFLFEKAAEELATKGALTFTISHGKVVRVGPMYIEFDFDGEIQRFNAEDIGRLELSDGWFRIHHKDARWFSLAGKYRFAYSKLANAQLFLIVLERVLGIKHT